MTNQCCRWHRIRPNTVLIIIILIIPTFAEHCATADENCFDKICLDNYCTVSYLILTELQPSTSSAVWNYHKILAI